MLYTVKPGQQRRDGKVKRIWTIGKARPLPGLLTEGRDNLRQLLQKDAAMHVTAEAEVSHQSAELLIQTETSVTPSSDKTPQLDDQPEPTIEPVTLPESVVKRSMLANHITLREGQGLTLSAELLAVKQALAGVGAI